MDMIKFPVRFDSTGIEKLGEGSNDYYSQLLSICMLTEPGTHPMTPSFGSYDPAFRIVDKGIFVLNAAQFVPEVTITNIDISAPEPGSNSSRVSVSFDINQVS